ncbi:hypothetical protein [Microbulbifer sp. JTAC008]|uniref:hypothetical protein n=1 Tax=unclassified Microbulbifer TaxID=2619833 RepID=UPI002B2E4B4F|nr:hypothetical protein QT397_10720 [Microbulbifer sp. MKSA007]
MEAGIKINDAFRKAKWRQASPTNSKLPKKYLPTPNRKYHKNHWHLKGTKGPSKIDVTINITTTKPTPKIENLSALKIQTHTPSSQKN